jgi:two-component system, NarL family, response regulator NreC
MNLLSQENEIEKYTEQPSSAGRSSRPVKQAERKITVLVVDDHALVRRGLRRLLEDEASITVVGEAGDAICAVQMVRELSPRVVLMDSSMPGGDGIYATKEITRLYPETSVLMLSMHSEETLVQRAIDAGARGYILKKAFDLDLISAIRQVLAGELVLDSQLSSALQVEAERKRAHGLTGRELQVLRLIADGKSSKDIAHLLGISLNTVSAHRTRIGRTLGCQNSAELVAYAIQKGLVQIP